MDFGMQFFPCVGPESKPADQYFEECLSLASMADENGYSHIRIVEHYFNAYGGYSPNPMVFLSAASQRTKKARLVTGAILPIFNNPLKCISISEYVRQLFKSSHTYTCIKTS